MENAYDYSLLSAIDALVGGATDTPTEEQLLHAKIEKNKAGLVHDRACMAGYSANIVKRLRLIAECEAKLTALE